MTMNQLQSTNLYRNHEYTETISTTEDQSGHESSKYQTHFQNTSTACIEHAPSWPSNLEGNNQNISHQCGTGERLSIDGKIERPLRPTQIHVAPHLGTQSTPQRFVVFEQAHNTTTRLLYHDMAASAHRNYCNDCKT